MVTNNGMTNSARFYSDNKFDIEKCFKEHGTSIINAEDTLKYILDNSEKFTEDELQHISQDLADNFYTIIKTAIDYNTKNK